ncbi:MAG: hypothetical protein CMM78_03010 [Rhodospirillaceae bacterium]|jgi:hypothetical protein|uniref:hypothetical protein n=1 Tax=unclassified Hwanghaeella TaxID=2605944 RepID=UPI000C570F5C|nr:hypothetical protein [Rhodospirillales bacterium]MAX47155.1 hypothetical protein [Rhodospirillaceae bacterium]|tara:strand:- start:179 stop:394 length:216 start_codon:yes stop_codon:yes gene_type:complete
MITILKDVAEELYSMFMGDIWLSMAVLAVAAGTAVITELTPLDPLIGGAVLLVGCLLVVIGSVRRSALKAK